jgi:hypothetical protein
MWLASAIKRQIYLYVVLTINIKSIPILNIEGFIMNTLICIMDCKSYKEDLEEQENIDQPIVFP